jgi:hypothetical protein
VSVHVLIVHKRPIAHVSGVYKRARVL